ncbi:MAG: phenylalanine--tRNA ligase subunit alpha [Candidatus Woesearchaeota archaeon]
MTEEDIKSITDNLHPLERKVLPHIGKTSSLKELTEKSGLKQVEVMRALQWLENKGLLELHSKKKTIIELDSNGKEYTEKGLPEKRFLRCIRDGWLQFDEIQERAGLSREEFNVCIGVLKRKAAIEVKEKKAGITGQGLKILEKKSLEEQLIEKIHKTKTDPESLEDEERFAYESLKKRKGIIKESAEKTVQASLTEEGERARKSAARGNRKKDKDVVDRLTPGMIRDSAWKNKRFRKYDITSPVPRIHGGKRHFVNQAIRDIKRVWLDMGFSEMTGPMLDTSFWNFDALFTAQDHPVRELQDTFYIKNPEMGKLPDSKTVKRVKRAHEDGGDTGSKGWGYKWSEEEAKRNVLRTHTTVLSAKTIARLKRSELPAKFFSVAKCFRNEALDWTHLFELHQIEGIVVDPDANFRHLLGYLREFFRKLGYDKVRVRPAYFPYTEPSAEVEVFHPVKKRWIELAGAGMFRPEVVKPLIGEEVPVLAWGMGLERSIAEYFNIDDIRNIYNNDLKMLREIKIWRD